MGELGNEQEWPRHYYTMIKLECFIRVPEHEQESRCGASNPAYDPKATKAWDCELIKDHEGPHASFWTCRPHEPTYIWEDKS